MPSTLNSAIKGGGWSSTLNSIQTKPVLCRAGCAMPTYSYTTGCPCPAIAPSLAFVDAPTFAPGERRRKLKGADRRPAPSPLTIRAGYHGAWRPPTPGHAPAQLRACAQRATRAGRLVRGAHAHSTGRKRTFASSS